MTNYIYVNTGTGGVYRKGQLGPIGQGSEGVDIIIEVRDLNKAPVNLTGYSTITATMEKRDTGAVTAVDGTLALNTTGADGLIKWTVSANDTGTDGTFWAVFDITNGTDTYISLPCELVVTDNPSVSASANNLLVGILQAVKDWLTAEKAATEATPDGNLLQSDGDNSEDSGIAAADVAALIAGGGGASDVGDLTTDGLTPGNYLQIDDPAGLIEITPAGVLTDIGAAAASDLTTHEALTTTAHGGVIPQDTLILSKTETYEVAAGDAGKTIECSGTFTVTFPNGLGTGFQVTIVNVGAGVITLSAATTLQGEGTQLATQYTGAVVYHRGSNVWLAMGKLT